MQLELPTTDDLEIVDVLGAKGYRDDVALVQYAQWAARTGMIDHLAAHGPATEQALAEGTELTPAGVDALVGVLATLGLVQRTPAGLTLSAAAREYLVPSSPFYMGDSLFVTCSAPIPDAYVKPRSRSFVERVRHGISWRLRRLPNPFEGRTMPWSDEWRLGSLTRLQNQHSRNLPGGVAASRLAIFDDAACVIDVGGGTGTFAIPLAQRRPELRVVLTDLPEATDGIDQFLASAGLTERIELVAMNVFDTPWPVPEADALFFGNVIHIFDDDRASEVAATCRRHVRPGGVVVFHELVWNDDKTGPLKTALFNATMRSYLGKQRTVAELHDILGRAGFVDFFSYPTLGGFAAVGARAPSADRPSGST